MRILIVLVCLASLGAGAAALVWQEVLARLEAPHPGIADTGVFVDVEPGDSVAVMASRLTAAGVVAEEWLFRLAVRRSGRDRDLQAGEYFFDAPVSPLAAVAKIADGRVHLRPMTFPEGLTLPQMASIVEAKGTGVRGSVHGGGIAYGPDHRPGFQRHRSRGVPVPRDVLAAPPRHRR